MSKRFNLSNIPKDFMEKQTKKKYPSKMVKEEKTFVRPYIMETKVIQRLNEFIDTNYQDSTFNLLSTNEHYIFFGLNRSTGIYEYVCYVNPKFSSNGGSPIICEKRMDDGSIVKLTNDEFLNINIRELSILIYNLLLINQQNNKLLHQNFFQYLLDYVFPKILEKSSHINNKNLNDIVGKIKEIADDTPPNNTNNNVALPPRRK